MTCCVGPCSRDAVIEVAFAHEHGAPTGRYWGYCGWHGLRNGRVRWEPWRILDVRQLTSLPE